EKTEVFLASSPGRDYQRESGRISCWFPTPMLHNHEVWVNGKQREHPVIQESRASRKLQAQSVGRSVQNGPSK
ncbi:Hypothetical predicted protein, partial [Marmota monax]